MNKSNIPRCMSTQHPDNVSMPFFATDSVIGGKDEIIESYYIFSSLECTEQMWDSDGKEVDNFVIKKLLSKYSRFFHEKKLWKDIFITLRVPNPFIEKTEAKLLLETLESIPRSYDIAKLFYGEDITPIFEVILPMASDVSSIDNIYKYYTDFVVWKQNKTIRDNNVTIADWIWEFHPKKINVIPLFEEMEYMLDAHNIVEKYLEDKKDIKHQRVFLAMSDPALNYGMVSGVLLNKIALQRLDKMWKKIWVEIFPISGMWSAPFRWNLKPNTVDSIMEEFPSVQTYTIQSSFKYDNGTKDVINAIEKINNTPRWLPTKVDEERAIKIIDKYTKEYQKQILILAPLINKISSYIPRRRKRKLHIGLFGYSRSMDEISLPRAIPFTCACYSIWVPPEILALNVLNKDDILFLNTVFINFGKIIKEASRYLNQDSPYLPKNIKEAIKDLYVDIDTDQEHKEVTDCILRLLDTNELDNLQEKILSAATIRGFLG